MKVLGLDIATSTGWSVINDKKELIEYGTIKLKDNNFKQLANMVKYWANFHEVDVVVIEAVYQGLNVKTTAFLNQLQGAVKAFLPDKVTILNPTVKEARKVVLKNGRANKQEVYNHILTLYPHLLNKLNYTSDNDITDSILLALYYFDKKY